MRTRSSIGIAVALAFALGWTAVIDRQDQAALPRVSRTQSLAMDMFDWWYSQRALPNELIPHGAFQHAVKSLITTREARTLSKSKSPASVWRSLGPTNVAGRILSLAVDPVNTQVIWAGAASGGLWKTVTGGLGQSAWTYINTGFPSLSVSAIAIDPISPSTMYVGTGEISFYRTPQVGTPGARSSYGMGILKSTDGGVSWNQTELSWTFPQVTAVQRIIINPLNTHTLYAATSEGIYKSLDAGNSWSISNSVVMAMDIAIDRVDTARLYSSHGSLNSSPDPGIYRSTDAGATWIKCVGGLPTSDFGRTALATGSSGTVYAAITDAVTWRSKGLYRSTDHGLSWTATSTVNYATLGWFANAVSARPGQPQTVFWSGLDIYKSSEGGFGGTKISDWRNYYMGTTPTGGSEGSPDYVHADHHAIVFDPYRPDTIYFATDGGVFRSTNGGTSFAACNGGLLTTQFYAGFSNAWHDSNLAFGGLQDNGTLKYLGAPAWSRVDDGDGSWTAIDPSSPNIVYNGYTYGQVKKSTSNGNPFTFGFIVSGLPPTGNPSGIPYFNFIPPLVIAPSSPTTLYLGGKTLYKTTNRGANWFSSNGGAAINGTKIACIAVSYTSPETLIVGTGARSQDSPVFQVFRSTTGGRYWITATGSLPNRYPTDIEFDPTSSRVAYLTFSGYGSPHVFRSSDAGLTWMDISGNLPDIPHQSITVDPEEPHHIYVGTDLGVFHSSNSGTSWEEFNDGMPLAMVLDVTVSRTNGAIRASTFGNGVYERPLVRPPHLAVTIPNGGESWAGNFPAVIQWSEKYISTVTLEFSSNGGESWTTIASNLPAVQRSFLWTVPPIVTSDALIRVSAGDGVADMSDAPFSIILNPDVLPGWNLLSLPTEPIDPRKSALFPQAISSAFAFAGRYTVQETLTTGIGYWLRFKGAYHLPMDGDSTLTDTIPLRSGWNLIGMLATPVAVADVVEIPDGIITSAFIGYQLGYQVADTLWPKRGYWVRAATDGLLILDGRTGLSRPSMQSAPTSRSIGLLTISDASGRQQTLYVRFGKHTRDPSYFDLPPLPPDGSFDARFTSNRFVEFVPHVHNGTIRFPITVQTDQSPIRMRWEASGSFPKSVSITCDSRRHRFEEDDPVTLTPSTNGLMILEIEPHGDKSAGIPHTFSLEQNYPNPFNPRTEITYRIADRAAVRLTLYDLTGGKVSTLVDEVKDPGKYRVEWDAAGISSGVYFYRLEAGNFTATKKLVLVR